MKLRNKKTGDTLEWDGDLCLCNRGEYGETLEEHHYNSLAKLNREWEDYEEPKDYWYVDCDGEIMSTPEALCNESQKDMKQMGNYFKTKEEAEKAVEKLKAWKRLEDKGFEFKKWEIKFGSNLSITATFNEGGIVEDLNLLFGGEKPVHRDSEETRSTEKEEE